jgi:hypothetical protein
MTLGMLHQTAASMLPCKLPLVTVKVHLSTPTNSSFTVKHLHKAFVIVKQHVPGTPVYAMHMSVSATAMLLRTAGSAAPRSWAAKWGTHALARPSSPRHSFPSAVHACA